MKRFNDGHSNDSLKRPKMDPDDVQLRMLIPNKVAGTIIGKGGLNISRLHTEFNARVSLPRCNGPERTLTIISSIDNALKILGEVMSSLKVGSSRFKQGSPGSGQGNNDNQEEIDVDVRMLIHQSVAGCIIGKKGFCVRELKAKTETRVIVHVNCCPMSTDRVVQIRGKPNACSACVKEVLNLLKTARVDGREIPYDANNYDEYYFYEYGGYGDLAIRGKMRGYNINGGPPRPGRRFQGGNGFMNYSIMSGDSNDGGFCDGGGGNYGFNARRYGGRPNNYRNNMAFRNFRRGGRDYGARRRNNWQTQR